MARILFVCPLDSIHSQRWVSYFADQTPFDVACVDTSGDPPANLSGAITLHSLPTPERRRGLIGDYFARYVPVRKRLQEIVALERPDLVHAHWVGYHARMIAESWNGPYVVTPWGSDVLINPKESRVHQSVVRRALRAASLVTCDSQHLVPVISSFGVEPSRVHIVNFGTDVDEYKPQNASRKAVQTRYGLPTESKLVVSTRSLKPIYSIETLIRAATSITERTPDARILVGSDGPLRSELEQLARDLGVADRVVFIGRLTEKHLQELVASADVYVSTSLSDAGLAASTAEAMASGVPPVVTDFGDNSDWVIDGLTGYVFPLRDHEALSDRVVSLLSDTDRRRRFSLNARELIVERNNFAKEMDKAGELYRKAVGSVS